MIVHLLSLLEAKKTLAEVTQYTVQYTIILSLQEKLVSDVRLLFVAYGFL